MERRRVLVVDDKEDVAAALAAVLEMHGYEAIAETDGRSALARAIGLRPEVVLLDLGMPGVSGHEICREIRKTKWGKAALVIALTGWARDEDRRSAHEAGFDFYLLKPVPFETIDTLLKGRDRRGAGPSNAVAAKE